MTSLERSAEEPNISSSPHCARGVHACPQCGRRRLRPSPLEVITTFPLSLFPLVTIPSYYTAQYYVVSLPPFTVSLSARYLPPVIPGRAFLAPPPSLSVPTRNLVTPLRVVRAQIAPHTWSAPHINVPFQQSRSLPLHDANHRFCADTESSRRICRRKGSRSRADEDSPLFQRCTLVCFICFHVNHLAISCGGH